MAGKWDVVVVGAGNAAFCAAQAAAEKGAKVLMVERAPKELMGGNSRFTAGAFRCVYDGVDDLKAIMPDLTKDEIDRSDFGTYTQDQFYDDMFRVTRYRTDGDLCEQKGRTLLCLSPKSRRLSCGSDRRLPSAVLCRLPVKTGRSDFRSMLFSQKSRNGFRDGTGRS